MKQLLLLITIFIFLGCNSSKYEDYIKSETINTECYIYHVGQYKYSKVQGYVYYHGIKIEVDNGNTGYYYKKYKIKPGDIINVQVTIYQKYAFTTNPYSDDIVLHASEIDVNKYEY